MKDFCRSFSFSKCHCSAFAIVFGVLFCPKNCSFQNMSQCSQYLLASNCLTVLLLHQQKRAALVDLTDSTRSRSDFLKKVHVSTSFIIRSTPKIFPYTLGLPCHPGTIEAYYHVCKMRKNILCPGFCCLKKRVLYFTTHDGTMYDIFTYIYQTNQPNVGKYTSPMDTMGNMFQFQLATSIKICEICTGQPA